MSKNTSKAYYDGLAAREPPSVQSSSPEPVARTFQSAQPQDFEYNSVTESQHTYLLNRRLAPFYPAPTHEPMYSSPAEPIVANPRPAQLRDLQYDMMGSQPPHLTASERTYLDPALFDATPIDLARIDPVPTCQSMSLLTSEPVAVNSRFARLPEIDRNNTMMPFPAYLAIEDGTSFNPVVQPQDLHSGTLTTTQRSVHSWRPQPVATTSRSIRHAEDGSDTWTVNDEYLDSFSMLHAYGNRPVSSGERQPVAIPSQFTRTPHSGYGSSVTAPATNVATRGGPYSNSLARHQVRRAEATQTSSLPVVRQQPPPAPTAAAATTTTSQPKKTKRRAKRYGCKKCIGIHFEKEAVTGERAKRNTVQHHIELSHSGVPWQTLAFHWGHRVYYHSGRSEDVPLAGQAASRRMPEGRRTGANGRSRVMRREKNKNANARASSGKGRDDSDDSDDGDSGSA